MIMPACAILYIFILQSVGSLTWYNVNNTKLPAPLSEACGGTDKKHSSIYLLGGFTDKQLITTISQFNGTEFTPEGYLPNYIQSACFGQMSVSIPSRDTTYFLDYNYYHIVEYNMADGSFSKLIPTPYNYNTTFSWGHPCITSNDTHIFLIGTANCTNIDICNNLFIYNIDDDTWNMDINVIGAGFFIRNSACGYYNHTLYSFNGYFCDNQDISLCVNQSVDASNIILYYDFNTWWTLPQDTTKLYDAQAISPNDDEIFYILAGRNNDNNATNNVFMFNASNQAWREDSPLAYAVDSGTIGFINGRVYILGGKHGNEYDTKTIQVSSVISTYSPTKAPTVSPVPTLPPTIHKDLKKFGLSNKQWIYCLCGMILALLFCCIGIRCCKKIRKRREYAMEGRPNKSVDGADAQIRGHGLLDTSEIN